MTETRWTTLSRNKLANVGPAYEAEWIGTPVVYTSWSEGRIEGVIESFRDSYPIIRFPDGRWARGDMSLEVVVGA